MTKTADEIVSRNPMSGIYTRLYECSTLKQKWYIYDIWAITNNNNSENTR